MAHEDAPLGERLRTIGDPAVVICHVALDHRVRFSPDLASALWYTLHSSDPDPQGCELCLSVPLPPSAIEDVQIPGDPFFDAYCASALR